MSNPYDSVSPRASKGLVNLIIDTPKGSRYKYKFDEKAQCFRVARILPRGASFPYDFGSIPGTLAEDGDPLDVLVIGEAGSFAGCLLTVKLVGAIRAQQREKGKTIRNDRLLGTPVTSVNAAELTHIDQLPAAVLNEIEHFFTSYNQAHGRQFKATGRAGPKEADKMLRAAVERHKKTNP